MGRKRAVIDWELVSTKAMKGSNGQQIADALGVHYDTLVKACKRENKSDLSDYLRQKRAVGDSNIHEKQYDAAMSGNVPMLIWLGKQRLGQTDKAQTDITTGGEKLPAVAVNLYPPEKKDV